MDGELSMIQKKKDKYRWLVGGLLAASVFFVFWSITIGYYDIGIPQILDVFGNMDSGTPTADAIVILRVRLPRIIAAFLIGAALSVSGSAYQGMFQNPLVSPDTLGVATGAGFGASLAIFMGMSAIWVQFFAFFAGLCAAFLSFLIGSRVKYGQTVSMILAGTMVGALCLAGTTLLKYFADTSDTLPAITFWLMGSLVKTNFQSLLVSAVPMAAGFIILFLMRWRLNVLTLGDEEARSVGINPRKTRLVAITGATLLASASVCLGGLIGWVGLMIPHISRGLVGPLYKKNMVICILVGGCFLLGVDDIARGVSLLEIPLGVLTAFVGAPFFIWLILSKKGEKLS